MSGISMSAPHRSCLSLQEAPAAQPKEHRSGWGCAQVIYPLGVAEAAASLPGGSPAERVAALDARLDGLAAVVRLGYLVAREGGWGAVAEWGESLSLGACFGPPFLQRRPHVFLPPGCASGLPCRKHIAWAQEPSDRVTVLLCARSHPCSGSHVWIRGQLMRASGTARVHQDRVG